MSARADRLKEARINRGFETASDAAEQLGYKQATYIQHENGTRTYDADLATKYARGFGVTPEWLLFGRPKGIRLPTQEELEAMVESALKEIPAGASLGDFPRYVAASLSTQCERFLLDRDG